MPSDKILGLTGFIDALHFMVHLKSSYTYSESTTIANEGERNILIVPVSGEEIHFTANAKSIAGAATATLYKGTTTTDDGTEVTPQNHYADSSAPSPSGKIYHTPSISDNGTQLEATVLGGGTNPVNRFGGDVSTRNEWIMTYPNKYLINIANNYAGDNVCILNVSFYTVKESS